MSTTTIWQVLNNTVPKLDIKRGIVVPMVQRDYAQGRKNDKSTEIRQVFLNSLLNGIKNVTQINSRPMELDFIYGFVDAGAFVPLDGQQRLTTLYLLHWYLAFKEEKLEDFKTPLSRFSYQTRKSSEDFLKQLQLGLTKEDYQNIFNNGKNFTETITNKNWYFLSWKHDLTVQSAITMLDEIHLTFKDELIKLSDLTNENKPAIAFNFLNIVDFGLSDDLYIKMNSRGKPLTNFENLKAELGKFIQKSAFNNKYNYAIRHSEGVKPVDVETYFVTKIDTIWTDYFWNKRNQTTNDFDDKMLNLLGFISLNEIVKDNLEKFDKATVELEQNQVNLSYYKLVRLELLNEGSIINYIDSLDLLVSDNDLIKNYLSNNFYINKTEVLDLFSKNNFSGQYEQRIFFYAILRFLIANKNNLQVDELQKWDRLLRNLVKNAIYNSSKDFQADIKDIEGLVVGYTGDIYKDFLNSDLKGFDTQQIKEEKLKIVLIEKSERWKEFIENAENHGYLTGQIIFALAYSGIYNNSLTEVKKWDDATDEFYYSKAKIYFSKFSQIFSNEGLKKFDSEIFRRALLTKGDFTLYSTNFSLIIDSHRDISWKRLLKEAASVNPVLKERSETIKALFDDISLENMEADFEKLISTHQCTDWRKDFIDYPEVIGLCERKYVKFFDDGSTYLLRKSKYNPDVDPEVKSVVLRLLLSKKGFSNDAIESGFIDNLEQYGITKINKRSVSVVYNHDGEEKFFIKQRGKEDSYFDTQDAVVEYLSENF